MDDFVDEGGVLRGREDESEAARAAGWRRARRKCAVVAHGHGLRGWMRSLTQHQHPRRPAEVRWCVACVRMEIPGDKTRDTEGDVCIYTTASHGLRSGMQKGLLLQAWTRRCVCARGSTFIARLTTLQWCICCYQASPRVHHGRCTRHLRDGALHPLPPKHRPC